MNIIQKILASVLAVGVLGISGYMVVDHFLDSKPDISSNPEIITADYQNLLTEAEQLKAFAGSDCANKKDILKQMDDIEKKLADLGNRKKSWLDSVPKLPELTPEMLGQEDPRGRPGSEIPELSSDIPALPEVEIEVLGSEAPELTSDVPSLPEMNIEVVDSEYIPELPEINTGRPGYEVPELTPDVPALPEIDEMDIINPDEYIFQMEDYENKIKNILQELNTLCKEEEATKKKVISDKCSDACQRYKDCAAYGEATSEDLSDAYSTCMEECATWPKDMVKCINTIEIKKPNDCVSFLNCQLPQFYEETYGVQ